MGFAYPPVLRSLRRSLPASRREPLGRGGKDDLLVWVRVSRVWACVWDIWALFALEWAGFEPEYAEFGTDRLGLQHGGDDGVVGVTGIAEDDDGGLGGSYLGVGDVC